MYILYYIIFSIAFASITNADSSGGYSHDVDNGGNQPDWMAAIHGAHSLSVLSIPGSHDSMALYGGWAAEAQTMSLDKQLRSGIRFLDIRCEQVGAIFHIHHGVVFQFATLTDVFDMTTSFLSSHSSETVIMRIKLDESPLGPVLPVGTKLEVFDTYYQSYKSYIWSAFDNSEGPKTIPTLGEVRGKIVIFQNFDYSATKYGLNYNDPAVLKSWDDWVVEWQSDLYGKWEGIKKQITTVRNGKSNEKFFQIALSAAGKLGGVGSFTYPWWVASGHFTPETSSPQLATGATSPGWDANWCRDYPRVACTCIFCWCIWDCEVCTIAYEGTNDLTMNYISGNYNDFVGIMSMDFPGKVLVDQIIAKNQQYYNPPPPVDCKTVVGPHSTSADDDTSHAKCPAGYYLLSCGIWGNGNIDGSFISGGDTCVAQMGNNGGGSSVTAMARCCKLHAAVSCSRHDSGLSGSGDDDAISSSCPSGKTLTGCTAKTSWTNIDGSFPGAYNPWSLQNGLTDTLERCNARNGLGGQGVSASSQCCAFSDNKYKLHCKSFMSAKSTSVYAMIQCPAGWFMSGCSGYSPWNSLEGWYVDGNNYCKALNKDGGSGVYAVAICCQETTQCDESVHGIAESGYSGCQDKTNSGSTCLNWKDTPNFEVGDHNFCRNPDGANYPDGIWCYTKYEMEGSDCTPLALPAPSGCDESFESDAPNSYKGCQSKTKSGSVCLNWKVTAGTAQDYSSLGDHNYCRNPDGGRVAWCYTSYASYETRVGEWCNALPRTDCDELFSAETDSYQGCQTRARSGKQCVNWYDAAYSSVGNHNYCRNPHGGENIWCYTSFESFEKRVGELCDPLPRRDCVESFTEEKNSYQGCQTQTVSGKKCVNWQLSQGTSVDYSSVGNHNYCRNPDGGSQLWCYTSYDSFETKVGEHCNALAVQECDENVNGNANSYQGCQFKTKSGKLCLKWSVSAGTAEDYSSIGDHNYCRNPDGDIAIWCYTSYASYETRVGEECDPLSSSYQGLQTVADNGKKCVNWRDTQQAQVGDHNYCRNPNKAHPRGIWCYTGIIERKGEQCDPVTLPAAAHASNMLSIPETHQEIRPETRPETRPDTRPDTLPETRPDIRPGFREFRPNISDNTVDYDVLQIMTYIIYVLVALCIFCLGLQVIQKIKNMKQIKYSKINKSDYETTAEDITLINPPA